MNNNNCSIQYGYFYNQFNICVLLLEEWDVRRSLTTSAINNGYYLLDILKKKLCFCYEIIVIHFVDTVFNIL